MGKLSETDAITYGLMLGTVGPLCTYLDGENGMVSAFWDFVNQVKISFSFDENDEFSMSSLGKTIVANFLPLYPAQFYSRQFLFIFCWFLFSLLFGGATSCHLAVVGLFVVESLVLVIRRSYLGFIFQLLIINDHQLVIILRYITLYAQYYGCSKCYWDSIAYIVFFFPKALLIAIDWVRGLRGGEFLRDNNGRFAKKSK